jgi:hypothetical protein
MTIDVYHYAHILRPTFVMVVNRPDASPPFRSLILDGKDHGSVVLNTSLLEVRVRVLLLGDI